MSATFPALTSRLSLVVALFAVVLSLAVVASVQAADYPPAARQAFTKSCVKGASSGALSRAQAKKACRVALNCIEDRIPIAQLVRLERAGKLASNKKVKGCIQRAIASVS